MSLASSSMQHATSAQRIVVGVTGGIAAYKAVVLVRLLVKAGHEVRVVMTQGATAFIQPLTFQAISGHPVGLHILDADEEQAMGHIRLAKWADWVMIAPASANTLAHLAHGLADDLLTSLVLATSAPVLLAPAMNEVMWASPSTQRNVQRLKDDGCHIIAPVAGAQACGDTGVGRMAEPEQIVAAWQALLVLPCLPLANKSVLITAGPTHEAIDPVRFIGNRSSGQMGLALAQRAQALGADVTLIIGPHHLPISPSIRLIDVTTAQQMHQAVQQHLSAQTDVFMATAAVADYRMADISEHKIKKTDSSSDLTLRLIQNPDVLRLAVQRIKTEGWSALTVGFAAETERLLNHAKAKFERKGVDVLMANAVGEQQGFDQTHNEAVAIYRQGQGMGQHAFAYQSKATLADEMWQWLLSQFPLTE